MTTRLDRPAWAHEHEDDENAVFWKSAPQFIKPHDHRDEAMELYLHVTDQLLVDDSGVYVERGNPLVFIGGQDFAVKQALQLRDALTELLSDPLFSQ